MTEEFVTKTRDIFPTTCHTMEHCYEFTYYDEMLEGFMCNFFSWGDGVWLTKSLAEAGYKFDEYISPCCTMIWRTVDDSDQFKKFGDEWWKGNWWCRKKHPANYWPPMNVNDLKRRLR